MSILEKLRSGQDSTFMQVVIALVILGFVGMNGQVFGDKSSIVATVNGDQIIDLDLNRAYQNELRVREAQSDRMLSDAEQKQLLEEVKQKLIEDTVILQEARRLGVEVSDREIARELRAIPTFRDEGGKYSPELYQKFLKIRGFTQSEFEERMREDLLRGKLQQLVYTGASISEPAVREAYMEAQTQIDLTVVQIRPYSFDGDVTITDEERTKWLAENEKQVKETYDRDFERLYNHPEQVQLRMIRLAVRDETPVADLVPRLNTLRDRITAGEDMAELAKRWSEDPSARDGGDLGLRAVSQLGDTARSIEGLAEGAISTVITTSKDARIVRVEKRLAPSKDEFEDVKAAIADRMIKAERVPALAQAFAEEQVRKAWAESGAVPNEVLSTRGLFARPTGPISAHMARGLPPEMMEDARSAEVNTVFPRVYEYGGAYFVGQLTSRIEPDMSEFDKNKEQITEIVLQQRRMEFFQEWIADLKARATISG